MDSADWKLLAHASKGRPEKVDQQTRAALKQDKFVTTTSHGLEWASENRRSVITTVSLMLAVIVVIVLGGLIYNSRSETASVAFGAAMQTYQSPLTQADEPAPSGVTTYPSAAARAKAANALFLDVANEYGMTPSGHNARYFAGLTYMEAGQNQQAEDTLKQVADSWNGNLAALAKFALAELYRNSGRDPQAVEIYSELTAKPTTAIPANLAQLELADLYASEGRVDAAKQIYATLSDKDAKGPAGAIAKEKLNPAPSVQMGQQP
jgi:tetratricopeptide (TPR) repeat protein